MRDCLLHLGLLVLVTGCGDAGTPKLERDASTRDGGAANASEAGVRELDAARAKYRLSVHGQIAADAEGAKFFTQNVSSVAIPADQLAGKGYLWAISLGGESLANAELITGGMGTVSDELSFDIATDALFEDGPYEFSMVINVTGGPNPPVEGDLASFSFANIEDGGPPATGVSVRFNVHGADATLELDNSEFIRF